MENSKNTPMFKKVGTKPFILGHRAKSLAVISFIIILICCVVLISEGHGALSFAILIGGGINSFIFYCFGHLINVMDDNNALLKRIADK